MNLNRTALSSLKTALRRNRANFNQLKASFKSNRVSLNLKHSKDRTYWFRTRQFRLQFRFILAKSKLERNKVPKNNKRKIARNTQFHNSSIKKIRNQLWVFKRLTAGLIRKKTKVWWLKRYQEENMKPQFHKMSVQATEKAKRRK